MGAASTGYLKISVAAELVGAGADEDGMTAVSGLTGIHSYDDGEAVEQDLSGAPGTSPCCKLAESTRRPSRLQYCRLVLSLLSRFVQAKMHTPHHYTVVCAGFDESPERSAAAKRGPSPAAPRPSSATAVLRPAAAVRAAVRGWACKHRVRRGRERPPAR